MKKNIIKYFLLCVTMLTVLGACRKDEFVDEDTELKDQGKTLLKFLEGPSKTLLFEAFTNIKPIEGFSLRRDANSNAGLAATTIQLTKAAVPAGYTFLPDNIYTLQTASATKITRTATGLTVNLGTGDIGAEFDINVNGALLDPTAKYAMAYTISNPGNSGVTESTQKTITIVFTILNKYDGMYSFEAGSQLTRYDLGGLGIPNSGDALMGSLVGQPNRAFTTIDGNTLTWTPVWANGGGVGGVDNFRLYVDPVTNQTTMTALGNASLRNIPGKPNFYDPVTKTFTLNFEWGQTATTKATRDMNVVLKYVGKRP